MDFLDSRLVLNLPVILFTAQERVLYHFLFFSTRERCHLGDLLILVVAGVWTREYNSLAIAPELAGWRLGCLYCQNEPKSLSYPTSHKNYLQVIFMWTREDSNLWPLQCQCSALTNWATSSLDCLFYQIDFKLSWVILIHHSEHLKLRDASCQK